MAKLEQRHIKYPLLAAVVALLILLTACTDQPSKTVNERAEALAAENSFEKAAELLRNSPAFATSDELLAQYVDIVTGNYIFTPNFRDFLLADLKPGDDIASARTAANPAAPNEVGVEKLITSRLSIRPDSPYVNFAAGLLVSRGSECGCANFEALPSTRGAEVTYFEKAYNGGIYDYWSLFRLGLANQMIGDETGTVKALYFYKKSLELKDDFLPLRYNMGVLSLMTGQLSRAEEHARAALGKYGVPGKDADTYYLMARIKEAAGDDVETDAMYRKALELSPAHTYAFSSYLNFLRNAKRFSSYEEEVLNGLGSPPSLSPLFPAYLDFLTGAGIEGIDRGIIKKLIEKNYKDPYECAATLSNLGRAAESRAEYAIALACYERALEGLESSPAAGENMVEDMRALVEETRAKAYAE
ncbi:MAG: hypothetical protein C0608_03250 [Deltaproteobacteria bacterium]|nr:MAG: hypothetical protein C0608_03250 [Deltaproteobacteria bacterium]